MKLVNVSRAAPWLLAAGAGLLLGCGGGDERATRTVTAPAAPAAAPTPLPAEPPALVDIGAGLKGPSGLKATVMARGVTNVSDFAFDGDGRLFVTRASEGAHRGDGVYLLRDGAKPRAVVEGLAAPLGLTFVGADLYVASERRVDRYSRLGADGFAEHETILSGLPAGKLGWNDNLRAGPDGRLYMGIGSPCDACLPKENLAGTIVSFEPDGKDLRIFADNVRGNAFLAFLPGTDHLFAATNQINAGGPDSPPDELGLIEEGSDWGNPWCLDRKGEACAHVAQPLATLDTHAVVDGIAFLPGAWGEAYATTAVVSEWGPGKLVGVALEARGDTFAATPSVLVTGLENPGPLVATEDGALLVGEYRSGTIYRLEAGAAPAEPPAAAPSEAGQDAPATLAIAADPTGLLKFAENELSTRAGEATIRFDNASTVPHDVEITRDGDVVAHTETITDASATTTATLKPGTYEFFCTVPGHRDGGMSGRLTVK